MKDKSAVTETGAKYRTLRPPYNLIPRIFAFLLIVLAVYYLFHLTVFGVVFLPDTYLYLIMIFTLPLVFLYIPAHHRLSKERVPWYDILLFVLSFAGIGYYAFYSHLKVILEQAWEVVPPIQAVTVGLIIWAIVVEACRRTTGVFFATFAFILSLYPLVAKFMPGMFQAVSFSLPRVVGFYMAGGEGIVGLPMSIIGNIFIGFAIFSCLLIVSGGGKAILDVAIAIVGGWRGGAAKVSVVSSAVFASISGAIVPNILSTGSFTIPAMKGSGYPAYYAGAVEACASSGGPITPPVMGTVAFIMATWLQIPYWQVCVAAVVPAFLYYTGLMIQVDGFAAVHGLSGLPKSERPRLLPSLREFLFFLAALIVLVWLIVYLNRLGQAPFYAALFVLVIAMLRKKTRLSFKRLTEFLEMVARMMVEIIPIMAGVGFVLTALYSTGTATGFAAGIANAAGGNVYLMVILSAIASFIMGMGLTQIAIYFLLVVLLAPALTGFGLDPLAVHLFIMFTGNMCFITPPVAIGAFAAAALAGSSPMKTAVQATRLGIAIFFVPFFFVLNPAYILKGSLLEILLTVGTSVPGIILIASGVEAYLIGRGKLSLMERVICIVAGSMLMFPALVSDIIGITIIFLTLVLSGIRARRKRLRAVPSELATLKRRR